MLSTEDPVQVLGCVGSPKEKGSRRWEGFMKQAKQIKQTAQHITKARILCHKCNVTMQKLMKKMKFYLSNNFSSKLHKFTT